MKILFSTKKVPSYLWWVQSRRESCNLFTIDSKSEAFNQNMRQFTLFINTTSHFTEFFQGVTFEFMDLLRNNCTNYLLTFENSYEEICISGAFLENINAAKHRGLSPFYTKHNLFHQSEIGGDVELQNTHIALFKPPLDMMQVSTLSAQPRLVPELVDWYRDATSVPSGHLLIDLSPRTGDWLRFCTNTGFIPSKFRIPNQLKQSKLLNEEHKQNLYSPNVPKIFPQVQKSSPVLPKRVC